VRTALANTACSRSGHESWSAYTVARAADERVGEVRAADERAVDEQAVVARGTGTPVSHKAAGSAVTRTGEPSFAACELSA
jgi:hypothetical protein